VEAIISLTRHFDGAVWLPTHFTNDNESFYVYPVQTFIAVYWPYVKHGECHVICIHCLVASHDLLHYEEPKYEMFYAGHYCKIMQNMVI
jgi:hypothetical protein